MRTICRCWLIAALMHTSLGVSASDILDATKVKVAIATDVRGEVFSAPVEKRLVLLSEMGAGERVRLKSGAKATFFFPSKSTEFTISGAGEFSVGDAEVVAIGAAAQPTKRELAPAYKNVKLRSTSLAQAGIVLRSASPESTKFTPANEKVACDKIALKWPSFGRGEYNVTVSDEMDSAIYRAAVSSTDFGLQDTTKLIPGASYHWTVSAKGPQNKVISKWAEFSCLTTDERRLIASLQPPQTAGLADFVTYALFLESAKVTSLAVAAWQDTALRFPGIELAPNTK